MHNRFLVLLWLIASTALSSCNRYLSFYVFSDTHCMDSLQRYEILDTMITEANALAKTISPAPRGLLVCGDLTDAGKPAQGMQFQQLFGLHGEQKLSLPVYENFGNHDGDTNGVVRQGIRARNLLRKNTWVSPNGLFYSWNWKNFHLVSLGSYPGNEWDSTCNWCHYFKTSFRDPQNSLAFLKEDLEKHGRNKQVILYFHYGWDDFSQLWWTEKEQEAFYAVIKDYSVAAIFTGHNHETGYRQWKGIDVYSAGSPQTNQGTGSFLVMTASRRDLKVQERRNGRWGAMDQHKKLVKNNVVSKP